MWVKALPPPGPGGDGPAPSKRHTEPNLRVQANQNTRGQGTVSPAEPQGQAGPEDRPRLSCVTSPPEA